MQSRLIVALCLLCSLATLALAAWECPGNYADCAAQVAANGCCRCATPGSGWSTSTTCAAGSSNGYCIVSCADTCKATSNPKVNCAAPCTFDSCDCGAFTLSGISSKLDPNSGTQLYLATFTVCNLCGSDADQVTIGGFSEFSDAQFNGYQSQVSNANGALWVWSTYSEPGFPSGVRFTRTAGGFKNAQCSKFTVATSSNGIINPSYQWLVQLSAGGRFEKTTNCANGAGQVTSQCLLTTVGANALTFTECCDGSIQSGGSSACSTHGGAVGTGCKLCTGACFPGGFKSIAVGATCPTCTTCCDGTSIVTGSGTCPTCCFDSTGKFIATTDPTNQCYALCCANGVPVKDPSGTGAVCTDPSNSCVVCCDGAIYDPTSYTQHCNCCENYNGTVRNIAQSSQSAIENCYYCLAYCGTLSLQACIDAGLMVTAKFTSTISPTGVITVKAIYSTNYVDNTWGTLGAIGWGSVGHKWDQVIGSDKISVNMKAADGTVVQSFSIDLVAGLGVSSTCPSGMCSGCVTKNTATTVKSDGGWSLGTLSSFVDCTTSTEVNCNSACALSLSPNPCSAGANSPTGAAQPASGPCAAADAWIQEYWWEWSVLPTDFVAHGGYSHPVITNIHASPSKFGADNCPVVVPQGPDGSDPYPCSSLGLATDTSCWQTCCDGTRRNTTCPSCTTCCDGTTLVGTPGGPAPTCTVQCCPDGSVISSTATCPTLCCDGQYRATCGVCCPDSNAYVASLNLCPVLCCDGSYAASTAQCPTCCCAAAQAAPCSSGVLPDASGNCVCTDGSGVFSCTSEPCCVGERALPSGICPTCCPGSPYYVCGSTVTLDANANCGKDSSGHWNFAGPNSGTCPAPDCCDGTTFSAASTCPTCCPGTNQVVTDVATECPTSCCDGSVDLPANCPYCCPDGVTVVATAAECPTLCCDGQYRATCGVCCPADGAYVADISQCTQVCVGSGAVVTDLADCPTLCCDGVYRDVCPICCPDYVDFTITDAADCKQLCCDGSLALAADCPFCCPNDGPVLQQSQCATPGSCSAAVDCVDCSAVTTCPQSCQPCGADCACECRSEFFQYCCPDGDPVTVCDTTGDPNTGATCVTAYPFYVPCNDPSVEGVVGGPNYVTTDGCSLNCTCGFVNVSCAPVPTTPTGCSANTDCQGCNLDPACVWCPSLGRCTSSCATGGDLLCGQTFVEIYTPVCYRQCYGNGDCVNGTCVCYNYGYVDKKNVYCAPLVKASSADKAAIGVIVGGTVGLLVLAVIIGGVLVFGTKAAIDALNVEDFKNTYMSDNKLYEPSQNQGTSAIYDGSGGR